MKIVVTDKTLAMAHNVVEAGVEAARTCIKTGATEKETIELLSSGLVDEKMSPDALLELLSVALILLAKQQDLLGEVVTGLQEIKGDLIQIRAELPHE